MNSNPAGAGARLENQRKTIGPPEPE